MKLSSLASDSGNLEVRAEEGQKENTRQKRIRFREKFMMRRSEMQTRDRIKSCEKVYRQACSLKEDV
jgi:hypothetical protein